MDNQIEQAWKKIHVGWFIAILLVMGIGGWFLVLWNLAWTWAILLLLMVAFIMCAGYNATGEYFGCLIDPRNRMSLSRFQLICWTLLVLSALLASVLYNIQFKAAGEDALVAIPKALWVLMGISTTSLLGSPLLLQAKDKKAKEGNGDSGDSTVNSEHSSNCVHNKSTAKEAGWGDLLFGEAENNAKVLDVARVQMFYFTLIALLIYIYLIINTFREASNGSGGYGINSLPEVSGGLVALLGISHTAYLAKKSIDEPTNEKARKFEEEKAHGVKSEEDK